MTGTDFQNEIMLALGESLSTIPQQQTQLYPRHIRRAADEVARNTWCLYRHVPQELIGAGYNGALLPQAEYVIPYGPFSLGAVSVLDTSGNIWPLAAITPEEADKRFFNWRAQNASVYEGIPAFYIAEGLKTYRLFPAPNYSMQDGLIISGYFGVDQWWDMGEECPLGDVEGYNEAIIAGAAYRRCQEMMATGSIYAQMLPVYKNDFEERIRDMYRDALRANAARRGGAVPSRGIGYQSWAAGWTWGY